MDKVQVKNAIDDAIDKELRRLRNADILRSDIAIDEVDTSIRKVIYKVMEVIAFPRPTCIAVDKVTGHQCGQPLHHHTEMHENGLKAMTPWRDVDCTPESLVKLNELRLRDGIPTENPPIHIHEHLLKPFPDPVVEQRPLSLTAKVVKEAENGRKRTVAIKGWEGRRSAKKNNDSHSGNGRDGHSI